MPFSQYYESTNLVINSSNILYGTTQTNVLAYTYIYVRLWHNTMLPHIATTTNNCVCCTSSSVFPFPVQCTACFVFFFCYASCRRSYPQTSHETHHSISDAWLEFEYFIFYTYCSQLYVLIIWIRIANSYAKYYTILVL